VNKLKQTFKRVISNTIQPGFDDGVWVCGGAALSLYTDDFRPCQDIDVYCRSVSHSNVVQNMLLADGYAKSYTTDNAITFSNLNLTNYPKVQLIIRNFDCVDDVLNSFDITICKIAVDSKFNFRLNGSTKNDIKNKVIRFNSSPGNSNGKYLVKRLTKYYVRGYNPSKELIEYMCRNKDHIQWNYRGLEIGAGDS
jgi:hypothetical protein